MEQDVEIFKQVIVVLTLMNNTIISNKVFGISQYISLYKTAFKEFSVSCAYLGVLLLLKTTVANFGTIFSSTTQCRAKQLHLEFLNCLK